MIRSDLVRFLDPSSYGPIPVVLTGVVCPAMPGRRRISLDCSQRISKMSQSQYWVGALPGLGIAYPARMRESSQWRMRCESELGKRQKYGSGVRWLCCLRGSFPCFTAAVHPLGDRAMPLGRQVRGGTTGAAGNVNGGSTVATGGISQVGGTTTEVGGTTTAQGGTTTAPGGTTSAPGGTTSAPGGNDDRSGRDDDRGGRDDESARWDDDGTGRNDSGDWRKVGARRNHGRIRRQDQHRWCHNLRRTHNSWWLHHANRRKHDSPIGKWALPDGKPGSRRGRRESHRRCLCRLAHAGYRVHRNGQRHFVQPVQRRHPAQERD
jgi:hypothetical protein